MHAWLNDENITPFREANVQRLTALFIFIKTRVIWQFRTRRVEQSSNASFLMCFRWKRRDSEEDVYEMGEQAFEEGEFRGKRLRCGKFSWRNDESDQTDCGSRPSGSKSLTRLRLWSHLKRFNLIDAAGETVAFDEVQLECRTVGGHSSAGVSLRLFIAVQICCVTLLSN